MFTMFQDVPRWCGGCMVVAIVMSDAVSERTLSL